MSKRLILISACLFLLSIPAYAAVQNVKVGGDINLRAITRNEINLNNTSESINYFMETAKVNLAADLTENVSAAVMLLDERDWSSSDNSATDNTVYLEQGYVTLKEMFLSPLSLKIGRQPIRLGNGLVVGDPDTNNTQTGISAPDLGSKKAFDALVAIWDQAPLTLTAGYIKADENDVAQGDDVDAYLVNLAYDFEDYNALAETYFVAKNDSSSDNGDEVMVYGIRGSINPTDQLNLQGELAWQWGDKGQATTTLGSSSSSNLNNATVPAGDIKAMAAQVLASYAFPVDLSPTLGLNYTFLSGDSDLTSGDYEAWDPLYEDQGTGTIFNYLFNATNFHAFGVNGSIMPREDLLVKLGYTYIRLDEALPAGSAAVSPNLVYNFTTDKHVGDEIDLDLIYDYTEDVSLGLSCGWFLPGDAIADNDVLSSTKPSTANVVSQVIGSMRVVF